MGLKQAQQTLRGMGKTFAQNTQGIGKTIAQNTPGPKQLAEGFRETARGIWIVWVFIAAILIFGEPLARWLTH